MFLFLLTASVGKMRLGLQMGNKMENKSKDDVCVG